MSWRGKLIGGGIGSFLGPWGAIAGAAVGHFAVDRKGTSSPQQTLRLLAVTAAALEDCATRDGPLSSREDRTVRDILAELNLNLGTGLTAHELAYLVDDAARIDRGLTRLATMARRDPALARAATIWLWRVAVSDGAPTCEEEEGISAFARQAGLGADDARLAALWYARRACAPDTTRRAAACQALGVPLHADPATIRQAYRALSHTYHPDKHANLPDPIQALTSEKFAQIKAAYDTLALPLEEDQPADGWHVQSAASGRIEPAAANLAIHCLACRAPSRLPPDAARFAAARCPACQALLVFSRDQAQALWQCSPSH